MPDIGPSTAGRIHEYDAKHRQACANAIKSCSSQVPGAGIQMNGSIITKDMIDGAADRLKDGSIRLYLGNHQQDEAGGYTGKDQAITLRMVGPRAATTMTGLKCLLIHEIVHAAHHIAGKPMSNYTDEGLAFAVEAVVRLSFKLPLDQVCSAALGLIGSGGLGDPVADLNRALSEARYRDYAKKYHVTRFRRKKA